MLKTFLKMSAAGFGDLSLKILQFLSLNILAISLPRETISSFVKWLLGASAPGTEPITGLCDTEQGLVAPRRTREWLQMKYLKLH